MIYCKIFRQYKMRSLMLKQLPADQMYLRHSFDILPYFQALEDLQMDLMKRRLILLDFARTN
jgi:hypothetical protein